MPGHVELGQPNTRMRVIMLPEPRMVMKVIMSQALHMAKKVIIPPPNQCR
jgi:hypothetical protein